MVYVLIRPWSILIVLGERHTKAGVHRTEDDSVGDHLDDVGGARREAEKDSGREEDEEDNGDKNVGVEHLF